MTERDAAGRWLTYRYRLGGPTAAAASGTIKAPSFLAAARRLVSERLIDRLGAEPAFLRLRAAGEDEVLMRVTPNGDAPRLEGVPAGSYRFDRESELGE
jgi:hypothetical protein